MSSAHTGPYIVGKSTVVGTCPTVHLTDWACGRCGAMWSKRTGSPSLECLQCLAAPCACPACAPAGSGAPA